MAIKYKVLGQSLPNANTFTNLYAVPAGNSAVVSTLNVCNQSTSNITFRIAVRPANETLVGKHYVAYDVPLPGQDAIALTMGMSLDATDVVTVFSFQGNVAFNLFGSEIY
jgi:hypothetical protein